MRKLEDIPKNSVFKVPDGYFDQLPTAIQARMAKETTKRDSFAHQTALGFSLKFALPVVALIVAGIFWFRPAPTLQNELENIDTEQIALYLANAERVDLEENHESLDWTKSELDELEDTIISNMESTEELFNDIDLENL